MRIIAHLSDIHFGAEDPPLVEAVRAHLAQLQPHLVVLSGDLTQRARRGQFLAARTFLASLPGEKLIVPGNHDVPLWNLLARFLTPLTAYSRLITRDLSPAYYDEELAVVGINTARSWTRKSGRINDEQAAEASGYLRRAAEGALRIVVTHHPFDLAETFGERELVGRARMALQQLAHAGVDVLLAGHFHEAYTGGTARRYPLPDGYSALVVQSGTATSTRTRGTPNSFNILRYEKPQLEVEILCWDAAQRRFVVQESKRYRRLREGGMERLDAGG
jgi:3',5'-cyclic AMP phosphodiesterase CpdA